MGSWEWFILVVLSILWGGSFFFGKVAVVKIPPFTLVLCRVGMAAVALHLVVAATGGRVPADFKLWALFIVMGLIIISLGLAAIDGRPARRVLSKWHGIHAMPRSTEDGPM